MSKILGKRASMMEFARGGWAEKPAPKRLPEENADVLSYVCC
jgi:hypothetical protein